MGTATKLLIGTAVLTLSFIGASSAPAATFHLAATASGNWNDQGIRTGGNYQIGNSTEHPHQQAAYFAFNLNAVKGRTVTDANVLIPGSTDYTITSIWSGHTPSHQLKVGVAPQGPNSVSQITTGNNNKTLYINAADANRNQDLGYNWVVDGLHKGKTFDAFHYNNARFQAAVNRGGAYVLWSCSRVQGPSGAENYIWGNTRFTTAIVLNVTTR